LQLAVKIHGFILQFMFANSAATARIPSWFEFIRHPRRSPPEQLKPVRPGKIERMNGEQLALLDRVLGSGLL